MISMVPQRALLSSIASKLGQQTDTPHNSKQLTSLTLKSLLHWSISVSRAELKFSVVKAHTDFTGSISFCTALSHHWRVVISESTQFWSDLTSATLTERLYSSVSEISVSYEYLTCGFGVQLRLARGIDWCQCLVPAHFLDSLKPGDQSYCINNMHEPSDTSVWSSLQNDCVYCTCSK